MTIIQPIILIVCYIIGELIKLLFKSLDKKWLPFIIGAIGMILSPLICKEMSASNIATGLISGFASSGGYDAIKAIRDKCKEL